MERGEPEKKEEKKQVPPVLTTQLPPATFVDQGSQPFLGSPVNALEGSPLARHRSFKIDMEQGPMVFLRGLLTGPYSEGICTRSTFEPLESSGFLC